MIIHDLEIEIIVIGVPDPKGDPMAVQLENTFPGRLDTSPWTTLTIL